MQSIKIVPEQVEDATSNIRLSNIRKILENEDLNSKNNESTQKAKDIKSHDK